MRGEVGTGWGAWGWLSLGTGCDKMLPLLSLGLRSPTAGCGDRAVLFKLGSLVHPQGWWGRFLLMECLSTPYLLPPHEAGDAWSSLLPCHLPVPVGLQLAPALLWLPLGTAGSCC